LRQAREPPRDFRLAHARGTNHQDVLGRDLFGHLGRQALPAIAIPQRDSDRALGLGLADDEPIQFGNDFTRGHDDAFLSELFDDDAVVGVDADVRGNLHGLLDDARASRSE
jgi:hypothetical protein